MQVPVRVLHAVRPEAPWSLLAAVGAVGSVFVATPFLIPAIAAEYGLGIGVAGLVSTVHVAAFAVATALAGRWLPAGTITIRRGLLVVSAAAAASAVHVGFGTLLALRVVMGAAEGVVTWAAWASSASSPRRVSDLTTVIPASVVFVAPPLGLVLDVFGLGSVLAVLAVATAAASLSLRGGDRLDHAALGRERPEPAAPAPGDSVGIADRRGGTARLQAGLGALALGTSATYVYAGAIGAGIGLGATVVGGAMAANALAGMVASRLPAGRLGVSGGFAATVPFIVLTAAAPGAALYLAGMVGWGFAYWLALPAAMRAVAARAARPEVALGRAHSAMAIGRMVGPVLGGFAAAAGFVPVAVASSLVVVAAAVLLHQPADARPFTVGPADVSPLDVTAELPVLPVAS